MNYEELKEVWRLKRQITAKQQKVTAMRESALSITSKYSREYTKDKNGKVKSYPALDLTPKGKNINSRLEEMMVQIVDTEAEIEEMSLRMIEAVTELTAKIMKELTDEEEQTLMIYRYVACKYFREIGRQMEHSEQWVYWKHRQILKKFEY